MKQGVLQPGAKPLGVGTTGAVRGLVRVGEKDYPCIAKPCNPQELAAECFCALMAREVALRAPEPILVHHNGEIWFGSIDLTFPNLVAYWKINLAAPDALLVQLAAEDLAQWAGCGRLLAFDVLIDNADRNLGNLLFDGQDYAVIDHARSLGLWPSNQVLVKLLSLTLEPLQTANLNAAATAAALTFDQNAPIFCGSVLQSASHIAAFESAFLAYVKPRLQSLATTVSTLL